MITFEATATINADLTAVWATMIDTNRWADWDSGVLRVECNSADGRLSLASKVKVTSAVNPGRAFPAKVTTLDANERMVWTGGMPLGLFKGERTFTVENVPAGTQFTMRETFSGPMLKLIARTLPDLQPSFEQFAAGLKAEVETRTNQEHGA